MKNTINSLFTKPILYLDMDNVLVDFPSAIRIVDSRPDMQVIDDKYDEVPGIFSLMKPMKGAVEAFNALCEVYDVYILSTAPWDNPSAWTDKLLWVKKYLGEKAHKRLILSHHKNLNTGDFLVDDRTKNGAGEFQGTLIQFGTEQYPDWDATLKALLQVA